MGISFICLFRVIFCAFIADKVDGVVDKGSGGTTFLDVDTLGGLFKRSGLPYNKRFGEAI